MATYTYSNSGTFTPTSGSTAYKLDVSVDVIDVSGGWQLNVTSYVTMTRNPGTPAFGTGTKSMSLPGGRATSTSGSLNESASGSWAYDFGTTNPVTVYNFTRYVAAGYGSSTSVSISAAGSGSTYLTSKTVTVSVPLISPTPVTQNSAPTLSGTGISGTSLSATAGTYSAASSVTTVIGYNTSGSFSGYLSTSSRRSSPYTVTDIDASNPPFYFAAYDEVVGTNGTTYYFYSSTIKSKLLVSFDGNGGSTPSAISYYSDTGTALTLPSTSRSGYTFNGWYTASSGGSYVGGSGSGYTASASANTTLYAQWTAIPTYSVTYAGNGNTSGTVPTDGSTYASGATVTSKTNSGSLAKTGYTFGGWSISSGGTVSAGSTFTMPSSAVTLTAIWNSNTYTITFDSQGGNAVNAISGTYGSQYGTLPTPTRTGYTFNGWFTATNGGGTQISSTTTYSSSYTVYASWTEITYPIYFSANNGTGGPSSPQYKSYSSNFTIPATVPTRSGYVFIGWGTAIDSISVSYNPGDSYTTNSSISLYAIWGYRITWDAATNGGTVSPAYNDVVAGQSISSGPTPTRTGYSLNTWGVSFPYTPNAAITLTATYTANTYTATFKYQDGVSSDTTKTVTYNSQYGTLPTPTRTGYSFNGWFTATTGGTQVLSTTVFLGLANLSLYAQWTINTYNVQFDANGGTGAPTTQVKTYNVNLTLSATQPTRSGYTFAGWNTVADGSGTVYASSGTYSANSAATLYAQWLGNTYVVTYNANGGNTLSPSYKSVIYGSTYGTLPIPTRTSYSFTGWYTAATGGYLVDSTQTYSTVGDSTIYAQWTTLPTYTVTWVPGNGLTESPSSTYSGNSVVAPTESTPGYVFNGWYTAATGGTLVVAAGANYTVNANITLYGQWTALAPNIYVNGAWTRASSVKVWNGTSWVTGLLTTWNGSSWVPPQ